MQVSELDARFLSNLMELDRTDNLPSYGNQMDCVWIKDKRKVITIITLDFLQQETDTYI